MSKPNPGLVFAAVILAAGRSTRMGRPKLLLPWGSTSILGHIIGQWQSLGAAQVAVVCASGDQQVLAELSRIGLPAQNHIHNLAPERGMFSSIQCAAAWPYWRQDLTHWLIILGDQPHLALKTLSALLAFAAAHPDRVCQPVHRGRRRHPVLLPKSVFEGLRNSSAPNLKEFLRPCDVASCELDDPGLALDIDTPEDYHHLKPLV